MRTKMLAAVAALGLLGAVAKADSVQVYAKFNFPSANASQSVTITDPSLLPTGSYGVGAYTFSNAVVSAGTGPNTGLTVASATTILSPPATHSFQAVCIDFTHDIAGGTTHTWNIQSMTSVTTNGVMMTAAIARELSYLWNTVPVTDPNSGAVLQMAVWDVLYNSTIGNAIPTDSLFNGSNGNSTLALTDAHLAFQNQASTAIDVYALVDTNTSNPTQSFAIVGPPDTTTNVGSTPLPRSAYAGFSLLAGLGGFELLRKRQGSKPQLA